MRIFIFLHILFVVAGVAAAHAPAVMAVVAARSRDHHAIRGVFGLARRAGRFVPIFFGMGLLFGLIAVFANGFNPLAPWLVIAYVLFVVATVVNLVGPDRWIKRVSALAVDGAGSDGPALDEALADRRAIALVWAGVAIDAIFIFDMVVKPFS